MSKTKEFALSLAEDFKKAEYLSTVDEVDSKAFVELLMILPKEDANEVAAVLLDIPADKDNEDFTAIEQIKVSYFELALLGHLISKANADDNTTTASPEAEQMIEDMYQEAKALDPAFAKWAFGPNTPAI